MSTQGVGTFAINSFWESGRLIFYEKAYGHTTTGDVFILGADYVQVGDTANDVNFQWYGTGSKSFVLDLSGATATSAGLAWTITGDLAVTGAITLTGDVSLTGDLTLATEDVSVVQGRSIYLDGQDGGEYLRSDTANELMLNATTNLNLAIAGTDEVNLSASALSPAANDGNALGTSSLGWSDLYLASGSVIHFNNTDVLLTHASNTVTLSGGSLAVAADCFVTGAPTKMLVTTKSGTASLTTAESGVILVTADDVYIYLPTYVGNSGLTYFIKAMATYSAGVYVEGVTTTQTIDGDTIKLSSAQYDTLGVITDGNAWYVIDRVGTWS